MRFIERNMTDEEFARRCAGAREYAEEQGVPVQTTEEFSFVALDGGKFIGCATADAYKNGDEYGNWAYLTCLFMEKPYRSRGLGGAILRRIEDRLVGVGIANMHTMTAGHEARGFYIRQGYDVIFELEDHHPSGQQSHIGLRKKLGPAGDSFDTGDIRIVERPMIQVEFDRMNAGFDEYHLEHGLLLWTVERHGFVAMDGDTFVGCVSGLTAKSELGYNKWFNLSDLFVEKTYRGQGIGTELLRRWEGLAAQHGARNIRVIHIAGYESLGFFQKRGYEVYCELEDWYPTGHSAFRLRRVL